jgi:hypothetical protein
MTYIHRLDIDSRAASRTVFSSFASQGPLLRQFSRSHDDTWYYFIHIIHFKKSLEKLQFDYIRSTHSSTFNASCLLYGRDRMVTGIAMVKVLPGQEKSVYSSLKGKEGILDLYHVFGEYDFFLIMQAESLARLNGLMDDIQEIRHVITAQTYW